MIRFGTCYLRQQRSTNTNEKPYNRLNNHMIFDGKILQVFTKSSVFRPKKDYEKNEPIYC